MEYEGIESSLVLNLNRLCLVLYFYTIANEKASGFQVEGIQFLVSNVAIKCLASPKVTGNFILLDFGACN